MLLFQAPILSPFTPWVITSAASCQLTQPQSIVPCGVGLASTAQYFYTCLLRRHVDNVLYRSQGPNNSSLWIWHLLAYLFTDLLTCLLTYLRTYLLTCLFAYSMELSSSWKANRFLASQEIPHILWIPKIHYRDCKSPTLSYEYDIIIVFSTTFFGLLIRPLSGA